MPKKKRISKKNSKATKTKSTTKNAKKKKVVGSILSVLIGVAVFVGYYVDIDQFITNFLNKKKLDVNIAYFEKNGNEFTILNPESISLKFSSEDYFIKKRIPFDLNIAIKNKESKPLDVVRVDLIYDKNLYIESKGKGKIDPNDGLIIYQHNVGNLDNVGFYTPLETIDTVYLPISLFMSTETIALLKDGVPMYVATVFSKVGDIKIYDLILRLGINVYCKDRPTLEGYLNVRLSCDFKMMSPFEGIADFKPPTKEDIQLVDQLSEDNYTLIDSWENLNGFRGHSVGYKKLRYNSGIYQLVYIDKQLRKIIANPDADDYANYELHDTTFDGIIDQKAIFKAPAIMIDWKMEASK